MSANQRVFIDACVLFPPLVRSLTLSLASAGFFTPLWSQRVLDEWRIAAARKQGSTAVAHVEEAQARLRSFFPDACVETCGVDADFSLPDTNDEHVLAAAIAGNADALLTFNLRDFPPRTMARFGIVARHPDGFLWEIWCEGSSKVRATVEGVLDEFGVSRDRPRAALKRAKLPRFGKALDPGGQKQA